MAAVIIGALLIAVMAASGASLGLVLIVGLVLLVLAIGCGA